MLNYELSADGILIFDNDGEIQFIIEYKADYIAQTREWILIRVESVEPFRAGGNSGFLPIETIGNFRSLESAKYRALSNYLESKES